MVVLHTDVLVIGAGPTGLMAANQLNRFGIDFIIIDKKNGPTEQSRAIAVTSRSLEIYEQMGLSDEVIANGQRINSFHFFTQGKQRGIVKVGEIGKGLSDFNYLLGYEQSKNEELLTRNLIEHGQKVLWGTGFVELKEYHKNIQVLARNHQGDIFIEAKYLIACDGASSPVRHQLKMKFEGGTYENKFFVADTILRWKLGYDGLVISPADRNFVGFFPMKGKSNYRVLGTLPDDYSEKTDITFHDIEKVVVETLGIDIAFEKVNWFSIYNLHHRRVDQFREGSVFVAGDAAHIHSPAGGQGMNTGLQDAYNLAWKLAFVIRGYAKQNLLETYNEERLPFAKWLMSFTDRGFNLMTTDNWLLAFIRKHFASRLVGLVVKQNWFRPRAFKILSQIGYSYHGMALSGSSTNQKLKFKSGDRLPYVVDNDVSKSIYHLFTAPAFHLLHIGMETMAEEECVKFKKAFPFPMTIVESKIEHWQEYGVKSDLYIIIRPDNYILYLSDSPDVTKIHHHLSRHFAIKEH